MSACKAEWQNVSSSAYIWCVATFRRGNFTREENKTSLQYSSFTGRGHSPQPMSIAKGLQASAYMLFQSSGGTGICKA